MEQHRLEKLNKLREMGLNPYVNSHIIDYPISHILEKYKNADFSHDNSDADNLERLSASGRIIAIREFGKTAFLTIRDRSGDIQVYIKKALLTEEEFAIYQLTDIGDFIGVEGTLFKTKTGELTLRALKYRLLTKALRDLPEKWHGLKDVETRYRKRYLDLIVNNDVKNVFITRSKIIAELRSFFIDKGFIEVETPMMHSLVGGANAKPFITHHNALDMQLYLRIAPELYLKRLVVGGIERVFELNRNFRNEGVDTKHNPEFTMVEWYMAYADYHLLMDMIEEMVTTIAKKVCGTDKIKFGELEIDLSRPWARLTMAEAIEKYSNIKASDIDALNDARAVAQRLGLHIEKTWGVGKITSEIFDAVAEAKLINPTFIIDYPKEISPLAKSKEGNPELTDRFELFVAGMELSNGFNELNDPIDQKERFQKQVDSRNAGDEEAAMMDEDFIAALEYGLPPTAGAGMGIDRLVMLLTNQVSIRDVLLFPYMRNID